MTLHIGRGWTGNELEKDCPCPKARCGLIIVETFGNNGCPQHDLAAGKTIRQTHSEDNCPANN